MVALRALSLSASKFIFHRQMLAAVRADNCNGHKGLLSGEKVWNREKGRASVTLRSALRQSASAAREENVQVANRDGRGYVHMLRAALSQQLTIIRVYS